MKGQSLLHLHCLRYLVENFVLDTVGRMWSNVVMEAKYKRGDLVNVWTPWGRKDAVLVQDAVWYHRGQCFTYEYIIDPLPKVDSVTGIQPSVGGSVNELNIRGRN